MASECRNRKMVEYLYKSLSDGDTESVAAMLASDLEWWFHGLPLCQHMMKVLTGEASLGNFRFQPRRVAELGTGLVVAEGWEGESAYWVHVWAIDGGVITQFREYFNTSVIVRDLGLPPAGKTVAAAGCAAVGMRCPTLWQSGPREQVGLSLPGLVLAV